MLIHNSAEEVLLNKQQIWCGRADLHWLMCPYRPAGCILGTGVVFLYTRAVWQARHSQNAWARQVERVESCRDVTWRAKWNLGYIAYSLKRGNAKSFLSQARYSLFVLKVPLNPNQSITSLLTCLLNRKAEYGCIAVVWHYPLLHLWWSPAVKTCRLLVMPITVLC